jgi:uncharacterized protein
MEPRGPEARSGSAAAARRLVGVAAALALAPLAAPGAVAARAEEPPPAAVVAEAEPPPMPFFLKGVDLSLPAQEAFRGWPPDEAATGHLYWFPWAIETFRKATMFDRPVLLALHAPWSHPSQRFFTETLKDAEVVRAIHEGFVLVVVDADRRPDIRERFQTGTWPVLAFLLPDGSPMISSANPRKIPAPITAGFVDPPTMKFLLREAELYYTRNEQSLRASGAKWVQSEAQDPPKVASVSLDASDALEKWLIGSADRTDGGFGGGAKFLLPGLVEYAAVRAARGEAGLEEPAGFMMTKLLASPLYDRREGGMHRLAMTPDWKGVQFEKTLEANAQLLRELVFLARQNDSQDVRRALLASARFLTTVLARPGGGFYLAQMADPRSKDGGAYWDPAKKGLKPPPVDRLVISGTNALAGAALLRTGAFLEDAALEKAGQDAVNLVLSHGYEAGRGVSHVIDPKPDGRRDLSDQAEAAFGLVEAHEVTGERRYLDAARDIVQFATRNLLFPGETALRDSLPDAFPVGILRNPRRPVRENVLLARAMLRLQALGAGEDFREQGMSVLGAFAGNLVSFGVHGISAALAVEESLRPPVVVRVDGRPGDPAARALRRGALAAPSLWCVVATGNVEARKASATISRGSETRTVSSPEALSRELAGFAGGATENRK